MSFLYGFVAEPPARERALAALESMHAATAGTPWSGSDRWVNTTRSIVVGLGIALSAQPYPLEIGKVVVSGRMAGIVDGRFFGGELAADGASVSAAGGMLDLFRDRGLTGLASLRGEATCALWDGDEEALILWRDPAGVRPMYVWSDTRSGALVFASDLECIAAVPGFDKRLDLQQVRTWLAWRGHTTPGRTLLQGVERLPPGCMLRFAGGSAQVQRFWPVGDQIGVTKSAASLDEDVDILRSRVVAAVEERLTDVHPVGAHLSGGLDSSSIAVLAARALPRGRTLHTYSWAPPREALRTRPLDERDLIDLITERESVNHTFTVTDVDDLVYLSTLDLTVRPAVTLQAELRVQRSAAAAGVGTILSGWGGDETVAFNGRGFLADLARRGRLRTVQQELRCRQRAFDIPWLGGWKGRVLLPNLPELLLRAFFPAHAPRPASLPPELRPELAQQLSGYRPDAPAPLRELPGTRRMQQALFERGHLQYRMEAWAAHGERRGLRYSFPLLDSKVIEAAWRVQPSIYFNEGWKRWGYRSAMHGVLPDELRWLGIKFDSAYEQHLRERFPQSWAGAAERLRTRRENPYVDIGVLLEPTEAQKGRSTHGQAAWLAFVG